MVLTSDFTLEKGRKEINNYNKNGLKNIEFDCSVSCIICIIENIIDFGYVKMKRQLHSQPYLQFEGFSYSNGAVVE